MTVISFSGIDGAGKSTQIVALEKWLRRSGLRTKLLTFWDDVVVLSSFREFMSLKTFKGDPGVGSPERPLQRRDKNVSSLPLMLARFGLYLADAISLASMVYRARRSDTDVVIFDRYIYDELANLPLARVVPRVFAKIILKFVPKPDVAYVVDAVAEAAQARKPEYPLEFVRRNREAYLQLAKLSGAITVVGPASTEEMKSTIRQQVLQELNQSKFHPIQHSAAGTA